MKCEQVKQLIPEWLDGEVDAMREKIIEEHVATCRSCRNEAAFWQEVGAALREEAGDVKAPPGFAARVTAQIPARPGAGLRALVARWKRGIAAAAAFLLVAAGSAGAYLHWWGASPAGQVADNHSPPGLVIDRNSGQNNEPGSDSGVKPGEQPGENEPESAGTGRPGDNKENPGSVSGSPPGKGNGQPGNSGTGDSGSGERVDPQQYALLNTGTDRVIERTLLKIKVEDMEAAHRVALDYINGAGAQYEVLGAENTPAGSQETLKIVVDNSLAGKLLEDLKTLGQVVTTSTQKDDITARYNEKVEQYRSLAARVEVTEDREEREQLLVKMAGIEAQLKVWDREAKTKTIILWLESW